MNDQGISSDELDKIKKYFGELEDLTLEDFKSKKKELRIKYHPDNFEKHNDEIVLEMATSRFQEIEKLSGKVELFLSKKTSVTEAKDHNNIHAQFAFERMKIEIQTRNKDLKYYLFKSRSRAVSYGQSVTIPETKARIINDENHTGTRIGFYESIRIYLTFNPDDSTEVIALWLYNHLKELATSLIIENNKVEIDLVQIYNSIRRKSYVGIDAPK